VVSSPSKRPMATRACQFVPQPMATRRHMSCRFIMLNKYHEHVDVKLAVHQDLCVCVSSTY
jgi:hypothetical protein